jgi:hypothetical protein
MFQGQITFLRGRKYKGIYNINASHFTYLRNVKAI